MFSEIMNGVAEFLGHNVNSFKESEDKTPISIYLSLGFDIPADAIVKVTSFTIPTCPCDITLVDIDHDFGDGSSGNISINDFTIINGRFTKVIGINGRILKQDNLCLSAMVLGLFSDIVSTITEQYMHIVGNNTSLRCSISLADILYYSPLIMSMAYIQEYYPFIEDEYLYKIYSNMYPKLTVNTIKSARRLVTEFTIKKLFDECVWYGVDNIEYPDIRCNSIKEEESDWIDMNGENNPFEEDDFEDDYDE